jgi:hypothetical protein
VAVVLDPARRTAQDHPFAQRGGHRLGDQDRSAGHTPLTAAREPANEHHFALAAMPGLPPRLKVFKARADLRDAPIAARHGNPRTTMRQRGPVLICMTG